ncbi:SDR family NAD(P)-dependent oxidoreductase [Flavobacterium luminosum]|uniref:Glucose 1-dehydrogenase n=1 Tax=Flavobacterium luminosum TaxID=2949086 RepID=A0ABT0TQE9_9FLAO|nr:glucose 1-dehydrogenase [Flavobacterium sp. HXWNR70]MCL9809719.1 glucose 1-dehydrogenase [Flavobacterium sp. HXWNR70]
MKQLQNKVAIITGSGSGIGKATALLFAKEGAKVTISDINEEAGKKVVEEIQQNGGEAIFVKANTAIAEDSKHLVAETIKAFGALHIAVNNAGVGSAFSKVADIDLADWQRVIDINLNGVFYGMKYQIPEMIKAKGGSIINIASILGQVAFQGAAAYVASKHAVVGLTKTGALDHALDNIRVNAIGPGFIYTGLVNETTMGKEAILALEQKHALHRLGNPEEVAAMCLFLASDTASFVTGSYYPVDGGYLAM